MEGYISEFMNKKMQRLDETEQVNQVKYQQVDQQRSVGKKERNIQMG